MGGNERSATNVYKPLFSCGALLPEADDHQEVVIDLALAKHVTQTDRAAQFCGLDGNREMMKLLWHCWVAVVAYSDGCRTGILISVGQGSDFCRTAFRFLSDRVTG